MEILKGRHGEPDAQPIETAHFQKMRRGTKGAFVATSKKLGQKVATQEGATAYLIWTALVDAFRIRRRKPFLLNSNITNQWGISRGTLVGHLNRLEKMGVVRCRHQIGKAPEVLHVEGIT
jgi:hypothetical protein